jgi:N-carbamoyl-L-amino-acid hydrolase
VIISGSDDVNATSPAPAIDGTALTRRLEQLGQIGRTAERGLTRLALTEADRDGRDLLTAWMSELDLDVEIDAIGNIYGTWHSGGGKPVMIGSHIDTVVNAGIYDGAYGVLAGLEVVAALRRAGVQPRIPLTVAAFTNEEGVRFTPDMMGSLVVAGTLSLEEAYAALDADGVSVGRALNEIGYRGRSHPTEHAPQLYLELHIEQGPVLHDEGIRIGVVEGVRGISWQRLVIHGEANHAGTTPMHRRVDAGHAAARIQVFLRDLASSNGTLHATVGSIALEPNAINVIPGEASITVDLRDTEDRLLTEAERQLATYCRQLEEEIGVAITSRRLARFAPVVFARDAVDQVEAAAKSRGLPVRRMTSGAGHDAQMMAAVAPTAMIFVPSVDGVSHSPCEHTVPEDIVNGANVLLDVTLGAVTSLPPAPNA